jgi:hypothetical protein
VAGSQGIVKDTLKIAKVDSLMVLYPTVEAATEGLRGRPPTIRPNP